MIIDDVGRWHSASKSVRTHLDILRTIGLTGWVADVILNQFAIHGFLVREQYYVPSSDELYAVYRVVSGATRESFKFQWVMCREIHDVLYDRYGTTRWPVFNWEIVNLYDPESPEDLLKTNNLQVVSSATLFDIPIRIDPAARSPLIELTYYR